MGIFFCLKYDCLLCLKQHFFNVTTQMEIFHSSIHLQNEKYFFLKLILQSLKKYLKVSAI